MREPEKQQTSTLDLMFWARARRHMHAHVSVRDPTCSKPPSRSFISSRVYTPDGSRASVPCASRVS